LARYDNYITYNITNNQSYSKIWDVSVSFLQRHGSLIFLFLFADVP